MTSQPEHFHTTMYAGKKWNGRVPECFLIMWASKNFQIISEFTGFGRNAHFEIFLETTRLLWKITTVEYTENIEQMSTSSTFLKMIHSFVQNT